MKWKKIAASTGVAFAAMTSIFASPALANYNQGNNNYHSNYNQNFHFNNFNNKKVICVWVNNHNNWQDWNKHDKKLVCFVYEHGKFYALNNNWDNHDWNWSH